MFIDIYGTPLHVTVAGRGQPALFLHGHPESGRIWEWIIEKVSTQYTCIAPDLPDFGLSPHRQGFDYSLDDVCDLYDQVLATLKIDDPITLIVHNQGGAFGLAWAGRNPNRVKRILIGNTVFSPNFRWHTLAKLWRTPIIGELTLAFLNKQSFRSQLIRSGGEQLSRETIDLLFERIGPLPQVRRRILATYRALDLSAMAPHFEPFYDMARKRPVSVIWGGLDPFIKSDIATDFLTDDVTLIPSAGHLIQVEHPELFADKLLTWASQDQ